MALGDLAHQLGGLAVLVHEVVLVAREQQLLVHRHVDGAHTEARELGGRGLHRADPYVARAREEPVLDVTVGGEDAVAEHPPPIEPAPGGGVLGDAVAEIGLVARGDP